MHKTSQTLGKNIISKIYLRKLTKKSIINFSSKFIGYTILDLIEINKSDYLRRIYFNEYKITFIDEILSEIGIFEEYRINKPGINPELGEKLEKLIVENKKRIKR